MMNIPKPLLEVSVIAANYNNSEFLADFFDSWIDSSYWPQEIIFVDDGSSDTSLDIAKHYLQHLPPLKIIELGINQGFANALNIGIDHSRCKYILRVDPDDMVMPDRLIEQYKILETGLADVVGSNAIAFNSHNGRNICTTNFPTEHKQIYKTIINGEHGVLHPTTMAHSELFKMNPYIQDNVPAEDYDIFARMLKSGATFFNISKPLLRYRIHQRSASNILPISTIIKTYELRDSIFLTKTSKLKIYLYYIHIKSYRKFLFSKNPTSQLLYALIASTLRPRKALSRLLKFVRNLTRKTHP